MLRCTPTILRSLSHLSQRQIPTASAQDLTLLRRFYADFPSHIKINMPALSPTMTMGNIGKWNKKIGDRVSAGDALVEIETDKATMDLECQEEGFLAKIVVPPSTKDVPINKLIAILAENEADVPKFADYTEAASPSTPAPAAANQEKPAPVATSAPSAPSPSPAAPAAAPTASSDSGRIFASPAAKKLALEKGVALSQISGTGPNGRIVLEDIEKFLAAPKPAAPAPAPAAAAAPAPKVTSTPLPQSSAPFVDIPLSNMRKIIAARLTESKQNIPHYYLTMELNADKLMEIRAELNKRSEQKLSVNDFIVKAASKALLKVPEVNSSWQGEFIRQFNSADISIAVATEKGLITPIVFSAEQKGLAEIAKTTKELSAKARDNKLAPHEYQGGTFSISNLGMFGVKNFTAIINPPQSCILAVGTTRQILTPSNNEKGFAQSTIFDVTLSCDHRVVDGAVGARWLNSFKGFIEDPISMLL